MFKKIIAIILILIISNITGCTQEKLSNNTNDDKVTYQTLYVDDSGGANYTKIQDAINNIVSGGTIYVRQGTYNEKLRIDKPLNLIGDFENHPKISYYFSDESDTENNIVTINADNCTFEGFDIYFSFFMTGVKGIYITSFNNIINYCNINNLNQGIFLEYTSNNTKISNCTILDSKRGIYVNSSNNNIFAENNISLSGLFSIFMIGSDNNILYKNLISDSDTGIKAQGSDNNLIFDNTIRNNSGGLVFCCGSANNFVYNNNFLEIRDYGGRDNINNQWDNGSLGNYWDDYIDKYPNATQVDNIWDTPYAICDDHNNCEEVSDRYPLVSEIAN